MSSIGNTDTPVGLTDKQQATLARLTALFGEPDYVNRIKPMTALWVDWNSAMVSARITPDGQWENCYDALVFE